MNESFLPMDVLVLVAHALFRAQQESTWKALSLTCRQLYATFIHPARQQCDILCDDLIQMLREEAEECNEEHKLSTIGNFPWDTDSLGRHYGIYVVRGTRHCHFFPRPRNHALELTYTHTNEPGKKDTWEYLLDWKKRWKDTY